MLDAYVAEGGPSDAKIRTMPALGYRLRRWQIRPEDSPPLFGQMDAYSRAEAQARAERLAARHVPAILKGQP